MKLLAMCLLALMASQVGAATKVQKPKAQQKFIIEQGAKTGGLAGTSFTLLDLKTKTNPKSKIERLMFDVGDVDARPQKGLPGFFNVELKNKGQQVVIDFAQMPSTKIDSKMLRQKLSKSMYVKDLKMLVDPTDNTLSLIMDLKKPAKIKVYQVPGKKSAAKVVLDLAS